MDRILVEHNGSKDAKRELIRLFWPVCQVYEQLNTAGLRVPTLAGSESRGLPNYAN
jgi:hypothetical protein